MAFSRLLILLSVCALGTALTSLTLPEERVPTAITSDTEEHCLGILVACAPAAVKAAEMGDLKILTNCTGLSTFPRACTCLRELPGAASWIKSVCDVTDKKAIDAYKKSDFGGRACGCTNFCVGLCTFGDRCTGGCA